MARAFRRVDEKIKSMLNRAKDKGKAIERAVCKYIEEDEPELKPEFIEKIKQIERKKSIRINNFAEKYGLRQEPSK